MAKSRKSISFGQKLDIITDIEQGETQASVSRRLDLSKTTVSTIWRSKETLKRKFESSEFSSNTKRFRSCTHKDVDTALLVWFKQARSNNIPVNGPLLLEKANSLASAVGDESFSVTTGFIDRWKTRHGIMLKKVSGEAGSVSEEDIRPWLDDALPQLLRQYKPEDVYNVDETGLFYKMTPDKSLTFKGEKCTGGKKAKER